MASRLERPRFFEGQYIGSADLEAVVRYARDLGREHALAGHSWGISAGLDLVEMPTADGGVDYFVLPGFGWDGYGRAIVVLAPVQVSPGTFAGLPSGDQPIWLRYDETPFRGLREGFETCGAGDAFARIRESFAIEVGPFALAQREGGINVAGTDVEDARLVKRTFSDTAPVMCDASVPYQEFPEDTARWLVPIGVATWQNGAPGILKARSEASAKLSRTLRRMAGTLTENVLAADGVIRLRDRFEQFQDGTPMDTLCAVHAMKPDDLLFAPDVTDSSKVTDRLVSRELVWVEGNLRVTGHARLFGTRLEFRDVTGAEAGDAPLYARRAVSPNNVLAGQDIQFIIGEQSDGKHRFSIGVAEDYGDLSERFVVRSDGAFAAGNPIPGDLKGNQALVARTDGVLFGLGAGGGKTSKYAFQAIPSLTELAHLGFDDDTKKLRLGVGTDLSRFTTWTLSGQVGIRMDTPEDMHIDAIDLVVKSESNAGMTLLGEEQSRGSIHFADRIPVGGALPGGFIRYEHFGERMKFGTNHEVQVTIDSTGDLGIGTEAPDSRIDIRESGSARALKLNAGALRAEDGGAAMRLDIQSGGGGAIFHSGSSASSRVVITGDGRIGIGTEAPMGSFHISKSSASLRLDLDGGSEASLVFASGNAPQSDLTYRISNDTTVLRTNGTTTMTWSQDSVGINIASETPDCHLHVRGTRSGSAGDIFAHVALIENMAGSNADVLALRVAGGGADDSNNFITFFDNSGAIGRIERSFFNAGDVADPSASGAFLRLVSGGADFAEQLPRSQAAAPIGPGRIVGVQSGCISLRTEGADALLVTTDRAVVVGNAANPGDESAETVALIGQVMLRVDGPVRSGDFILPSGAEDGTGRAVSPDKLTPGAAGRVVGRAWADAADTGPTSVLVAVGVQGADALSALSAAFDRQQDEIDALRRTLARLVAADG